MSRPLSGHLDDVDLDEVFKVIALARRSGLLDVEAPELKAELSFVGGRLVRIRLHDHAESVGALLVRLGLLRDSDLRGSDGETIEHLVRRVEAQRDERQLLVRVDDVMAEQLEEAALRVLQLRQGSFSFRVVHDEIPPLRYVGDTAVTLPAGVDTEELAREARRRRNERKNDPLAGIVPGLSRPRSPVPGRPELLVVDDDVAFLGSIERALSESGVPLATLPSARQALDRLPTLLADGGRAVVVDLVMPRADGRGILGGLEVLRAAHAAGVADRVFVAFEGRHEDAERIVMQLGAAGIVPRPKGTGRDELAAFLNPVLARLDRPPIPQIGFDLARELLAELGGEDWRAENRRSDENVKSLQTLKALLGELNDPSFDEEIPLLVLRFASAFFVRGALFRIDAATNELVGLGGFGVGGADPGRLVRSIRIPVQADTVFSRALAERCGVRQALWESEWNARLVTLLGGPRPREVYTAPLLSPRGVEAVLYADNATEPRPFPDIALLEIFLQQSAAAMERALLVRQLKTLQSTPPTASTTGTSASDDAVSGGPR